MKLYRIRFAGFPNTSKKHGILLLLDPNGEIRFTMMVFCHCRSQTKEIREWPASQNRFHELGLAHSQDKDAGSMVWELGYYGFWSVWQGNWQTVFGP